MLIKISKGKPYMVKNNHEDNRINKANFTYTYTHTHIPDCVLSSSWDICKE